MMYAINVLISVISSAQFLLAAILVSFSVKTYFLSMLIPQGLRAKKIQKPWIFLLGILAGSMFGDIAWIVKLVREIWLPTADYGIVTFFIRIAWAFLVVQYQSLALFIESVMQRKFKLRAIHTLLISIGCVIGFYFLYLAFFEHAFTDEFQREKAKELIGEIPLEISIMRFAVYYLFNILIVSSMYFSFKKLKSAPVPKILRKQLQILLRFLIIPYICIEFVQGANFLVKSFSQHLYAIVSVSTLLLTYAVFYCLKRVMRLRFLNFNGFSSQLHNVGFIDDFKIVFEQLSHANSTQELTHIIQAFFKQAFDVPVRKTMICFIRHATDEQHKTENYIETVINVQDGAVYNFIHKQRILMYDEIDFTNFYEEDEHKKSVLDFLDAISADIFLPIYDKQKIIAYIVVERDARLKPFNNIVERDQMLMFASYLGNILNLLQQANTQMLLCQEKELREELYNNAQEMNQYKESIRSFLRNAQQKEIGIIFYKSRRFIFANQAAKELINVNVNTQEGHPLTQALKHIARRVEEYKTPQTHFAKNSNGARLVLCGVPNLEASNVIITVYYPEISDLITRQMALLKDPSSWDYLLYLETTHAGQLINQLIPGSGEQLLHFKINFLKRALGRKIVMLEFPENDVMPAVELLHHISGRETLHIIDLESPEKNNEIGIKLFGMASSNPTQNVQQPLFKKLDATGTIFIKNIELLDSEAQEYLAGYIMYGNFRMLKSDQNISTNVRVLCSTQHNLQSLADSSKFSKKLLELLQRTKLSFPSLQTISDQELFNLIAGFTEQALTTQTFKNLLELNEKEKIRLLVKRPESLSELKNRVHQALIQKSKKQHIYDESHFDPAYAISDPELLAASRLGKHALRDSKIMALLWNKFKSQNQIATFLGVNRSSVNRRCKDYNLQ